MVIDEGVKNHLAYIGITDGGNDLIIVHIGLKEFDWVVKDDVVRNLLGDLNGED